MTFDVEAFEERSAIMEFDGGLSRFEAETLAAKAQGITRMEAMNAAKRGGNTEERRDRGSALAREQRADNVSKVQQRKAQEK